MINWAILIIYDDLKSSMHCTLKSCSAGMALVINIKERSSTVLSIWGISTQVQTHACKEGNTIHNQNPKCSSRIIRMQTELIKIKIIYSSRSLQLFSSLLLPVYHVVKLYVFVYHLYHCCLSFQSLKCITH